MRSMIPLMSRSLRSFTTFALACSIFLSHQATALASNAGEYVVHNRMEILKPIDLGAMNNDSQDAVLVEDRGNLHPATAVVDIKYYPLRSVPSIQENPNWQTDDRAMTEFLNPGVTSNWDKEMRGKLLSDLAAAGIDPTKLNDKQVVEKVSNWLVANFTDKAPFVTYYVNFKNGRPYVREEFRKEVDAEKARFGLKTDQEAFDHGLFGKSLFYHRIHGSCTPSAILWTTVFRALGIPTRIVETAPPVDGNDPLQLANLLRGISNNVVRSTLVAGVGTGAGAWANHTFVEVFVGKKWVRLNYNNLGQPILDRRYFGLLTVVNRFNDWSESGLVDTWGVHVVRTQDGLPVSPPLSSVNPYRSLGISDNMSQFPGMANPPGDLPFPLTATIDKVWAEADPNLPDQLKGMHFPGYKLIFMAVHEPLKNSEEGWLRFLLEVLSPEFILTTDNDQANFPLQYIGTFTGAMPSGPGGFFIPIPESEYQKLRVGSKYSVKTSTLNVPEFILASPNGLALTIY